MSDVIQFARGPLFILTLSVMILGLARLVFLRTWALIQVRRRTPKRDVPWKKILRQTASWIVPVKHMTRGSAVLMFTSVIFHVCLLIVPLFLAAHIFLWDRGLGISWPALGASLADTATLVTIATAAILFAYRLLTRTGRQLSRFGDFALLVLVALPFVSGYFATHPESSPLAYRTMLLIHILSGELTFVLMPFTKLAHVVLFPFDRISPEIFWRLVPGAGAKVAQTLRGSSRGAEA